MDCTKTDVYNPESVNLFGHELQTLIQRKGLGKMEEEKVCSACTQTEGKFLAGNLLANLSHNSVL